MNIESWYFNKNLKPQGPLSFEEMKALIQRGEILPQELLSCGTTGEWRPACEWGVFDLGMFPALQLFNSQAVGLAEDKEWVLLVSSDDGQGVLQEGPFSVQQLRSWVKQKKVSGQQYIWKSGMSGWCRLKDRPEFAGLV